MKGVMIALLFFLIIGGGAFFWLLSKTGPDTAPDEIVTTQLDDNFEK